MQLHRQLDDARIAVALDDHTVVARRQTRRRPVRPIV
jgi:hypothetical protein